LHLATQARERLRHSLTDNRSVLRRFPRLCAHLICESLGYATPSTAASILRAYIHGKRHYCEWLNACYDANPVPVIQSTYQRRHSHRGYMAHYPNALGLVHRAIENGNEPMLASWF